MCNIGRAFSNGSIQLSHALPNLVEVNIDYGNDLVELPADICDSIHLKKIGITNCHKLLALPEEIGKLAYLELLRLRSCTDLEKLPGSSRNLKKFSFLDISYCFSIKELPEDWYAMMRQKVYGTLLTPRKYKNSGGKRNITLNWLHKLQS
ncbi:hypothetical protein M0R45_004382 [Rubus argutus]|uniref:Uncharacterized protein n=1 Tax=Rubus argutus TaxID=59490 RepID=A0AAW1YJL0_RUBAR